MPGVAAGSHSSLSAAISIIRVTSPDVEDVVRTQFSMVAANLQRAVGVSDMVAQASLSADRLRRSRSRGENYRACRPEEARVPAVAVRQDDVGGDAPLPA
jgi:hypothetical protein